MSIQVNPGDGRNIARAPANRTRIAQRALQDRIKDLILERGLQPGEPIPTEAELVEDLHISRNTAREALKELQALGIIEIRHGFGTFVGDCSLDPFAGAMVFRGRRSLGGDRHDFREIVDLRQALEVGLVGQLVAVVDATSVELLGERLSEIAGAKTADDLAGADRAFHDQLYAPLDNLLMSQLLGVFWDVYHHLASVLDPSSDGVTSRGQRKRIVAAHQAIYDAVAAGDPQKAAAAVSGHFEGIRLRLLV